MKSALLLTCFGLIALASAPAANAAPPGNFWTGCTTGSGIGECTSPAGVAADPGSGRVYINDGGRGSSGNKRVIVLSPWGEFLEAWGWGVRNGAAEPQTCGPAATPPSSTCLPGIAGPGAGQFSFQKGIAVDSGGNVYVYESQTCTVCGAGIPTNRVQKLDPEGEFIMMFGGKVNLTKVAEREEQEANSEPITVTPQEENLCTAASGDACGPGVRSSGLGEFGDGPYSGSIEPVGGSYIGIDSDDTIYIGGNKRIQVFKSSGEFKELLPDPDGVLTNEAVQSLAVDRESDEIYLSLFREDPAAKEFESKEDVRKLGSDGELLDIIPVEMPRALAVDAAGNLYVVDGVKVPGPSNPEPQIRMFDETGAEVPDFTFQDGIESSVGIATSSACGIDGADLFIANFKLSNSFVRAYGPPPDALLCAPPQHAPEIDAQFPVSVGSASASLQAEINPFFWPDTRYYVEYGLGPCSASECTLTQPAPPGTILTTSTVNEPIATGPVQLSGLEPGATYHFRFVASSSGGGPVRGVGGEVGADGLEGTFRTFEEPSAPPACANDVFRKEAGAALPECRAYEMVSPVDKNGGDIGTALFSGHFLASVDGQKATYSSLRSFADPEAAPLSNQFLSSRGSSGWSSAAISPPRKLPALYAAGGANQFKIFSEDLCSGWVLQDADVALAPDAPVGVPNLYRRDNCSDPTSYELLTTVDPPGGFQGERESRYYPNPLGVSDDGLHTVFRADAKLTTNGCATDRIFQTYETNPGGPLRLISLLPGNKANCTHSSAGFFGGASAPPDDFVTATAVNAVSADGTRVYWSAGQGATPVTGTEIGSVTVPKLYLRTNSTQAQSKLSEGDCTEPLKACTLPVSTAPNSVFWAASPDGAHAIYTVGGFATAGSPGLASLFEYSLATEESELIAGGVMSVVGMSEDVSRVYFISTSVLSGTQQNSQGDQAEAGQPNLYLAERGVATPVFIGILQGKEAQAAGTGQATSPGPSSPAAQEPFRRSSRVSPDGLHLSFTSFQPLTGYDNTDQSTGNKVTEVFLYDADGSGGTGSLACVSCNPSGARPLGRKLGSDNDEATNWGSGLIPGWSDQLEPGRLLAADGAYLFFESFDRLVPSDQNDQMDVYQWVRAADDQECKSQGFAVFSVSAGGCLGLISTGQSVEDSEFIDASESGEDVFFVTGQSLVSQDPALVDVYDARVGGGFPSPTPPVICNPDVENDCQPPAQPVLPGPAPASTVPGAGNPKPPKPPKCKKGTHAVKKHGKYRCVKNKKPKSNKQKKGKAQKTGRAGR